MKVAGPVAAVMTADWAEHRFKLVQLRTAAFVDEQGVPPEIEMDSEDAGCHHLLALLGEEAVGAARLLADGRIGRLAVLKPHRGCGIGVRLLRASVALAESLGMKNLYLHAQVQTLEFYRREGFVDDGDAFIEAGIRHQNMCRSLL